METAYDWVTVMIYAGLVTRFLSESAREDGEDTSLWHYLLASVGCAFANWLGNEGWHLAAIAMIAVTLGYIARFILSGPRPQH